MDFKTKIRQTALVVFLAGNFTLKLQASNLCDIKSDPNFLMEQQKITEDFFLKDVNIYQSAALEQKKALLKNLYSFIDSKDLNKFCPEHETAYLKLADEKKIPRDVAQAVLRKKIHEKKYAKLKDPNYCEGVCPFGSMRGF